MKTAFLTDIHLNDREPAFMKRKRMELLLDFLNNETAGIEQVVFWGDIFDTVNIDTSSEIASFFFKDVVSALIQKGIKVDILVWNHEKLGRKNVYKLLNNDLTTPLLSIHQNINYRLGEDFNEIFVPYLYFSDLGKETIEESNEELKRQIEGIIQEIKTHSDKPIILYNHNCMWGVWFEIEKETNLPLHDIPWLDLIIWGHVHKYKELANNALYVGSFMRSFVYEEESEWYLTFEVNAGKINREYIPLSSYAFEKIILSDDEDFSFQPNHVYTITYKLNKPKDPFYVNNIKKKCMESGGFVIREYYDKKPTIRKEQESHINIIQSHEDILKNFLKEKKIKNEELKDYLIKLALCSYPQKFASIADAKLTVDTSHIEEIKVRKSRKVLTKREKKEKEVLTKLKEGQEWLINKDYLL